MNIKDDLLQLIAAAGRGEVIEVLRQSGWHEICDLDELLSSYHIGSKLRIKPKTITLAGIEFPEPLWVAPEIGAEIWIAITTDPCSPTRCRWIDAMASDFRFWLKLGLLQATEQGAKDQAKAMILSVGGSLE